MHLLEANRCKPRPFFLPSSLGRIFCVFHEPVGEVNRLGNLLVVPGFNEEMNRCRSMVTLLARELAVKGVGTLVIDLYGTGESDGEYGDARWDAWLEDIGQAMAWLDGQTGGCLALLGIRLGFPLAVAAMANDQRERALIGWQPVIDGKSYFTQFMRMKIAANSASIRSPQRLLRSVTPPPPAPPAARRDRGRRPAVRGGARAAAWRRAPARAGRRRRARRVRSPRTRPGPGRRSPR